MLVEKISELPPEPPTERQLDYARDLGISIPPGATKIEVSDLISVKVDGDKPSTARHREFAKRYGVDVTNYIGKKDLFDRIKNSLSQPGREAELACWFTYRVYRELVNGAENAPIKGPDNVLIQKIGKELALDPSVMKSIRRYEGRQLIWFGEWTAPNGRVYTGGSNRTIAYKSASIMLREKLGLDVEGGNDSFSKKSQPPAPRAKKHDEISDEEVATLEFQPETVAKSPLRCVFPEIPFADAKK